MTMSKCTSITGCKETIFSFSPHLSSSRNQSANTAKIQCCSRHFKQQVIMTRKNYKNIQNRNQRSLSLRNLSMVPYFSIIEKAALKLRHLCVRTKIKPILLFMRMSVRGKGKVNYGTLQITISKLVRLDLYMNSINSSTDRLIPCLHLTSLMRMEFSQMRMRSHKYLSFSQSRVKQRFWLL